MSFISFNEVNFTYPNVKREALKNINLQIEKGELVLIIGPSGGGKSTLLSMMKEEIKPAGKLEGQILIDGKKTSECSFDEIGYLFQDPNSQLVRDKVYGELVYSLENLNLDEDEVNERLGEIVTYLNLNSILEKNVHTLSGGNKQIVNIASLLLMHPKLLILDEPTSQIDPIHYDDIINLVLKLNKENKITTIITEHRYGNLFYEVDRVLYVENGEILLNESPVRFKDKLRKELGEKANPFIEEIEGYELRYSEEKLEENEKETVVEGKEISFSYDKKELNLSYINFKGNSGEIMSIVGANGCGKTTFLKLLAGIYYPLTGCFYIEGKKYLSVKNRLHNYIGYVPQDVNEFFTFDNVQEEFKFLRNKLKGEFDEDLYENLKTEYNLEELLEKHPTDLSGGEKQLIIIIIQVLKKAKVLILDEPTKGLDPSLKEKLGEMLLKIKNRDTAIVMVSHDIDFIYKYSDKCSMMFNRKITKPMNIEAFFENKLFYLPKHLIKARG